MDFSNKYETISTHMKRVVFTRGLGLILVVMVPWASIAKDQKEIGSLLQAADSPSASDVVQVKTPGRLTGRVPEMRLSWPL